MTWQILLEYIGVYFCMWCGRQVMTSFGVWQEEGRKHHHKRPSFAENNVTIYLIYTILLSCMLRIISLCQLLQCSGWPLSLHIHNILMDRKNSVLIVMCYYVFHSLTPRSNFIIFLKCAYVQTFWADWAKLSWLSELA